MSKKIFCTVTTDLSYDQRMIRICTSLAAAGYEVTLTGRRQPDSIPLEERPFRQKRFRLLFRKGKAFYLEYNLRLFFFLLFRRMDCICAIDLDTILPCWLVSSLRRIPRVYDAHELFCEMQEVVSRPAVYRIWKWVERKTVPHFQAGYTVNGLIAEEFKKMYGVGYEVIRNLPVLEERGEETETGKKMESQDGNGVKKAPWQAGRNSREEGETREKMKDGGEEAWGKEKEFILYQGAVNEGRGFEALIPAMRQVDRKLVICGDGNFMERARELVKQYGLEDKIIFLGRVRPAALKALTRSAWCGITLFESLGMSNYYSLANRFFDYMHAGIPQLAMNYPAYREINNLHTIAVLVDEPDIQHIVRALNGLLDNTDLYKALQGNCLEASRHYSWQEEEKKLIRIYQALLAD